MNFNWTDLKSAIGADTGLPDSVLHIHAGMLILVVSALVLRRAPWSLWPWLTVLVLECANEAYDLLQTKYPSDEGNLPTSWHDLWMTMLWPTVILLVFPWVVRRFSARSDTLEVQPAE